MIRGLELSGPLPNQQGGERGWKVSASPIANDLINLMKPPYKPLNHWRQRTPGFLTTRRSGEGGKPSEGKESFPIPLPFLCISPICLSIGILHNTGRCKCFPEFCELLQQILKLRRD